MGLQIRLTHSLGQRMIELQPRGPEQPVIIGRAPNAEVQVPSATVAKQHCMLFIYEGRWAVQDAGTQTGTYLNGEPIAEPMFLNSGDVLSLGNGVNPPTVTIDPFGLGSLSVGDPESTGLAQPAPSYQQAPPQAAYGGGYGSAGGYGGLPQPGTAPSGVVDDSQDDNIFAPAGAAQAGPAYSAGGDESLGGDPAWSGVKQEKRYYVPKKQAVSPGVIAAILGCAALALALVLWGVYNAQEKNREERSKPKVVVVPAPAQPTYRPTSIFDMRPGQQPEKPIDADKARRSNSSSLAPKVAPQQTPPPTNNTDTSSNATNEEPAKPTEFNPEKQDPKWQAVEEAKYQDPPIRIAVCMDFKLQAPNSSLIKEVDQIIDKTVDQLWWKFIGTRIDEKEFFNAEIKSRKEQMATSQDAEFKQTMQSEIDKFQEKIARANEDLKEVNYTGDTRPNELDDAQLNKLRASRDKEFFENRWKPQVLEKIRKTRGQEVPWKSLR